MSDWDSELETIAIAMSSIALLMSVTMSLVSYWYNISQTQKTHNLAKEIERRLSEQDHLIFESEVKIREDILSSVSASEASSRRDSKQESIDQEMHEIRRKLKKEVIPYITVLKLRIKQQGQRLQILESLFQGERKFPGNVDFILDPLSISPPKMLSPVMQGGSPKEVSLFYEILKQAEKSIGFEKELIDQRNRISQLENLVKSMPDKFFIPLGMK
ncbi:uncharacterized protein LOC106056499 isoform X1 [Biomphalaria glabrata]|uniref:Uncharacterized protein LOC106056499 isoform X1 n=1 Tax=Biomphalaria glabrata TaxID=6526 RepID=A0A9W2YP95_BIOGL|nr:uncharacterized protein LOC106056499 isoform X1 [Biomphalaria glabrata]